MSKKLSSPLDRAFSFIEQKPGLFPSQLRVLLGLKLTRDRREGRKHSHKCSTLRSTIKQLEEQKRIEIVKDPLHDEPRLYVAGTVPPPKLLFQPGRRQEPDCKVFKVPLDQLYLYTNPDPMANTPTKATQKAIDDIGKAIAELQLLEQPFTVARVLEVARVHTSFLTRHPDVKRDIELAVQQSGTVLVQVESVTPSDSEEVERLQAVVAQLEERNRELRQQLSGGNLRAIVSEQMTQVERVILSLQVETENLERQIAEAKQNFARLEQILSLLPEHAQSHIAA